jgi:hypothetical protein
MLRLDVVIMTNDSSLHSLVRFFFLTLYRVRSRFPATSFPLFDVNACDGHLFPDP